MEQFDQLLTCCICLDRYRTPKLLPCQHSYCLEPCMEGLVDYVKRQVKCPECRAEHRIPYNGIQGFPTNYTLTKFLELHAEITGELPDPNADAIMSRCAVCSEKAYVNPCAHCDKKVCDTCKEAHCDILKREISRINNQIKRGIHRIEDSLSQVERNQNQLKTNAEQVIIEIDEVHRRLTNALKERTDYLKSSVDKYVLSEMKSLKELKDNLDLEITNIQSNSDLMDKNMDDGTKWDDNELMDCKDIFLKMMDWIRNYDTSSEEYNRKIRFTCHDTVNELAKKILEIGDLRMLETKVKENEDFESRSTGLSRSKSDHRLVSEFRRQEEGSSPPMRRRFGETRYSREANKSRTNFSRFGGDEEEDDSTGRASRFRSRFLRGEDEEDSDRRKSLHMDDDEKLTSKKERCKVIETEDASRGPLSGCIRLADSSRVIQRLKEREMELKRPKKKDSPPPAPKPVFKPMVPQPPRSAANDDEIDRIKRENKTKEAAQATTTEVTATPAALAAPPVVTTAAATPTSTLSSVAVTASTVTPSASTGYSRTTVTASSAAVSAVTARQIPAAVDPPLVAHQDSQPVRPKRTGSNLVPESTTAAAAAQPAYGSRYTSRSGSPSSIVNRYAGGASSSQAPSRSAYASPQPPVVDDSPESDYSTSSDSDTSSDSEDDDPEEEAADDGYEYEYYTEEDASKKPSKVAEASVKPKSPPASSYVPSYASASQAAPSAVGSYYSSMGASSYGAASSYTEPPTRNQSAYGASASASTSSAAAKEDPSRTQRLYSGAKTSSYLTETAHHRQPSPPASNLRSSRYSSPEPTASSYLERRYSREDSSSGYSSKLKKRDDSDSFVSKYLAKSRSTAIGLGSGGSQADSSGASSLGGSGSSSALDSVSATRKISGELQYPSGRSRYAALKERKARLERSKSSAMVGYSGGADDDDDNDEDRGSEVLTPFTSRFGGELARSRSSHLLKNQGLTSSGASANYSTAEASGGNDENLSSWAKYLKNKYGNRAAASGLDPGGGGGGSEAGRRYETADQSKNARCSLATPQPTTTQGHTENKQLLRKFGSRGSQPGFFTWPRGIAVGLDNTIVVADSSNHRVQIFDESGQLRFWLGGYGNGEGEFDCLAGVAVNRIGQFIIADRYNHRIQIFDPSGQFLRTFGSQGNGDGKFNYPWGVCTDSLGFIYVCDKENHRIQIFQSDGTFVAKFGTMGNKPGQLEHPHYIAVSNSNRVVVSDSNNHRLQIFDVKGKVLTTFGSEGTEDGQFKFPRGVAIDEQGFIFVADSGNNRIQIFNPDGTFLRSFGRWGQNDGEFKGLEGIAVNSAGHILIADRENHRIQIFGK